MSAARHLSHLLRGQSFRKLFAVRVASQLTDGIFQTALAAYVVFSPEQQPSATAIAGALAVVLLPFSVLGPFVGVFLDRWSRRQVLVWSNLLRVGLVGLVAVAVATDVRGPLLFGGILACLSVNRFLLAGLSASLPHVVVPEDLVTANAVTPTAGTMAFLTGLAVGTGARAAWDAGVGAGVVDGDVAVLLVAAVVPPSTPTGPRSGRPPATSPPGWWPGCATSPSAGRRRTAWRPSRRTGSSTASRRWR
jgi:MFS family permease